jgi:hypothetical protein
MSQSPKITRTQELETLGVLAAFFLILNVITHRPAFVYAGLAMLLIALFVKPFARNISRGWLKFAEVIGTFNSKVILSLVFYTFLTPIAFLYRIFTKDPLKLTREKNSASYYIERNHTYTSEDLDKMW